MGIAFGLPHRRQIVQIYRDLIMLGSVKAGEDVERGTVKWLGFIIPAQTIQESPKRRSIRHGHRVIRSQSISMNVIGLAGIGLSLGEASASVLYSSQVMVDHGHFRVLRSQRFR